MEKGTCKMGWFVRNQINNFEGFVIGKAYWMFGCEKLILIPKNLESKPLIDLQSERVLVSEEFVELMPDADNDSFKKDFEKPDLDKYFGMICRDKVTGFEGVAIGCISSLYGTDTYALEPRAKKKKYNKGHEWFDVGRLEILSRQVSVEEVNDKKPGGCNANISPSLLMGLC